MVRLLTLLGRTRGPLTRLWYRLLRHLPVPSESKWLGMEELLGLVAQAALESDNHNGSLHLTAMERAMDQVGYQWMSKRAHWLRNSATPAAALAELMTLAFKTLNMPTKLLHSGVTMQAVTFRCPFVEKAKTAREARKICQMVCSNRKSLFHGFVQGLPVPADYAATRKMGWGDPECAKEFRLPSPANTASPGHRHKQETPVPAATC